MSHKSTHEVLSSIAGGNKPNLWKRVTGIPEFDPEKHSDGCSGGMSEAYANLPDWVHDKFGKTLPWRHCCVVHDKAYYYGGSQEEKEAADEALKRCVAAETHNDVLAFMMKAAVEIGGKPNFKTPYRWGYGEDFRGTEDLPAHKDD